VSDLRVRELSRELQQAIANLDTSGRLQQTGVVTKAADGVVWIYGLQDCGYGQLVEISGSRRRAQALVLSLGEDGIGAVLLGQESAVAAGDTARLSNTGLQVPVGRQLLGRVVDPLGRPLDDLGPLVTEQTGAIERQAPGVLDRQSVREPLATGITAIDTMVPIGRGQRELIIGDRKTGKTTLVIDSMINQTRQKTGVVCIYVAIGQKRSTVARLVERLKDEGTLKNSIVVATSPADPAPLLYLAPYAGCAMGEYFRDNGQHALIAYDDLTKHAVAYRQMSLLLRRPPGREAFPGDVFYLHSRLLERAAKLSDNLGGGSLTALPIIETQAGDVAAFIPTNVISITDGQIYLETDLFYQGIRPAISVGLSVSRVGSAAQLPGTKIVAGGLRLDLAQFRELAAFTQFSSDMDDNTRQQILHGRALTEVLKQKPYSPSSPGEQVAVLLAARAGAFDSLNTEEVEQARYTLVQAIHETYPKLLPLLDTGKKPDERMTEEITKLAKRSGGHKVKVHEGAG
jgi:F-type H+-transporting ATPase subunit alpha